MKKFSILVALILCVTIGSVYATWFYAETTMQDVAHEFKNLGITDVDTNAQTGRISVTDTLILKIDDNSGNHVPGWDTDVTEATAGNIKIVFVPNSGASNTSFKCVFTIENNIYNGQPIFTFADIDITESALIGSQKISETEFTYRVDGVGNIMEDGTVTGNLIGSAEKTITLNSITSRLSVNDAIALPTIADYNAYKTALSNVVLKLTITEVVSSGS